MSIGIFGGTFDPVHIGHLRAAEEIREAFGLSKVFFVPAFTPPHKRGKRIADVDERVGMLKMAIRGNSGLAISPLEIERGGVSYSIDTIETFEKRYGETYFILGLDAFMEIHTWRRYEDLFTHTHFVVMLRPGENGAWGSEVMPEAVRKDVTPIDGNTLLHASGKKIFFHRVSQLDISSTRIRDAAGHDRSIRYLVPDRVEKFIRERGLYRP